MNACSDACGWCGRCTDGAARDFIDSCSHPGHWRKEDGGCRLCGARPETLAKQARQRQIQPALPKTGAA